MVEAAENPLGRVEQRTDMIWQVFKGGCGEEKGPWGVSDGNGVEAAI